MASLFDFLFDSLPFAVAHHGAWLDTAPGRRTTIRDGLRRASLSTLRRQMTHLGSGRPPTLRNATPDAPDPSLSPWGAPGKGPLWALGLTSSLSDVGRGTCKVEEQDNDEMVVFERILWGREVDEAILPSVLVTLPATGAIELPLDPQFLFGEWIVHAEHDVPERALDLYPTQTRLDFALVRVFLYEVDTHGGRLEPFAPADPSEEAALERYRRAAGHLDVTAPQTGEQLPHLGEELCAFEPFHTLEELREIAGTVGLDAIVRFAITRPRVLVVTSLSLCKKTYDFEPGGVLGVAKLHPSVMVSASTLVQKIDTAVRVERPSRTTNLSRPGHCACSEMHEEIRPLLVSDTNSDQLLGYPDLFDLAPQPPYWGNFFSYYSADPHAAWPGRQWQVLRPLTLDRTATGLVTRRGPLGPLTLENDRTSKVAGQGDFDNIHLAPRMHLNAATHVTRELRWIAPEWRAIGQADRLELDPA